MKRNKPIYWLNYLNNFSLRSFIKYLLPMINFEQYENQWKTKRIVEEYSLETTLFKPEEKILTELKPILPKMSMLDIGVGTGRTTPYFASLSRKYLAIDLSANMIEFCKTKFKKNKIWQFKVLDARNLDSFNDKSFDFVLFSFNGLDYITGGTKERQKVLQEIRRLINNKGYFVFSTHNLNYLWRFCRINSLKIHEIRRIILLQLYNLKSWKILREQNKNITHIIVNVLGHNVIFPTYVSTPKTQIAMLRRLGYKKIRVFDSTGKNLELSSIEKNDTSYCLYYLCQV